jgi:hypothetical protein
MMQESSITAMGARLDAFPRLISLVAGCPSQVVGAWTVREICH